MKIVFAGSPAFAVPVLEKLLKSGKDVVAVITQPDKPAGRKQILTPTPVKAFALAHNLPVYDFKRIRDNADTVKMLNADIMITCAYGQILTEEILKIFKGGVWNIHASLLPKFRGASPIQSAILAGETHTGITVMKTELGVDTGDILLVKRCEIGNMTCGELTDKLSLLGAEAAVEAVEYLESGKTQLLMQDEVKATHCKKTRKSDAKIDFSRSPRDICRLIKAFSPAPAAFCNFAGSVLNVYNAEIADDNFLRSLGCARDDGGGHYIIDGHKAGEVISADKRGIIAACGGGKDAGAIKITDLQLAGGKRMTAADFVNGRKINAGDILE